MSYPKAKIAEVERLLRLHPRPEDHVIGDRVGVMKSTVARLRRRMDAEKEKAAEG